MKLKKVVVNALLIAILSCSWSEADGVFVSPSVVTLLVVQKAEKRDEVLKEEKRKQLFGKILSKFSSELLFSKRATFLISTLPPRASP